MPISRLTVQNALALLSLPVYLLARPLLRLLGLLRPGHSAAWVMGGHSGRLYADNSATLHQRLRDRGRDVTWICSEPSLATTLRAAGARVLRRNSFRARIAIENAAALIYSHGFSDLDHCLWPALTPTGLKVHLNHSLNHLKAGQLLRPEYATASESERRKAAAALDPFDYLLASSQRERENFLQSYPGAEPRIVLGGGAHLDAFMAARERPPGRSIVYFPTFRETPQAEAEVTRQIEALLRDPQLARWLEDEDYRLLIVRHINSHAPDRQTAQAASARIQLLDPSQTLDAILEAAAFVSDYSGLLCDFLALDRPTVFFAFDRAEYLRHRRLYVDYDDFAFGPQVASAAELSALITSGRFLELAPFEAKRKRWQALFFPVLAPDYAASSEHTIEQLLAQRARSVRGDA